MHSANLPSHSSSNQKRAPSDGASRGSTAVAACDASAEVAATKRPLAVGRDGARRPRGHVALRRRRAQRDAHGDGGRRRRGRRRRAYARKGKGAHVVEPCARGPVMGRGCAGELARAARWLRQRARALTVLACLAVVVARRADGAARSRFCFLGSWARGRVLGFLGSQLRAQRAGAAWGAFNRIGLVNLTHGGFHMSDLQILYFAASPACPNPCPSMRMP
jgi:hypothetical protein